MKIAYFLDKLVGLKKEDRGKYRRLKYYLFLAYVSISSSFLSLLILEGIILGKTYAIKLFYKEIAALSLISILIAAAAILKLGRRFVSLLKEVEKERQEAFSEIEHSSKLASIGRLAAGVAHEINNPLSIINQNAGLMTDLLEIHTENMEKEQFQSFIDSVRTKEKFLSLANSITDAVRRCKTITHRLLGFARSQDNVFETIDFNETTKEVISFLEKEIHFRDIQLIKNLDETLPEITTDKGQLQQVMLNIINNAVDAVERGGMIEITTGKKDSEIIYISIRDNGKGIPDLHIKHIFEPFYTTKEKGKGTGLGLFISYGIMKKLGGNIYVQSEENKGSAFTIELPLKVQQ
ncbi:integral membrane sensor signal transduction histidine kinase [Candidatus Magnetoovum chiemensis]|nr:integral membrane sensor signal transduction histidine kinase [Candidatus Magnetoovum chiemensis]